MDLGSFTIFLKKFLKHVCSEMGSWGLWLGELLVLLV